MQENIDTLDDREIMFCGNVLILKKLYRDMIHAKICVSGSFSVVFKHLTADCDKNISFLKSGFIHMVVCSLYCVGRYHLAYSIVIY